MNRNEIFCNSTFNTEAVSADLKRKEATVTINPIEMTENFNNLIEVERYIRDTIEVHDVPMSDKSYSALCELHNALYGLAYLALDCSEQSSLSEDDLRELHEVLK